MKKIISVFLKTDSTEQDVQVPVDGWLLCAKSSAGRIAVFYAAPVLPKWETMTFLVVKTGAIIDDTIWEYFDSIDTSNPLQPLHLYIKD